MLSERDYMHDEGRRPAWRWSATIAILVANVIVFGIQYLVDESLPKFPINGYFALSLSGLKSGYFWQFLTFQFMHAGFAHIILNSWAIFVFGRVVEQALGTKRMVVLYFLSGVLGGGLQMLGTWLLPGLIDDVPVVGASAGAFGLVAAFAALYPNQVLYMLLFFVIPMKMKAKTFLWIAVVVSLVGIIFPYISAYVPAWSGIRLLFENIGHAAHLGGIISGYIFARQIARRSRQSPAAHQYY